MLIRPVLLLALLACGSGKPPPPPLPEVNPVADDCRQAGELAGEARKLRSEGYLGRALRLAKSAVVRCPSPPNRLVLAETYGEIGLDQLAIETYQEYAATAGAAERSRAEAAITALAGRPPHQRAASDEEQRQALMLYRDAIDLRLAGDYPGAIRQLRRSYALAPHPLTIVQIALAHRAAGETIAYRKANSRALAIAELIASATATPQLSIGHGDYIVSLAVSSDGAVLASADFEGTIKLWSLATGQELATVAGHLAPVVGLAFNPAGDELASVGFDGRLKLWDPTGRLLRSIEGDGKKLLAVAFDHRGERVAVGASDGRVHLYQCATGQQLVSFVAHSQAVTSLAFAADDSYLASASLDRTIGLWRQGEAQPLARLKSRGPLRAIALSGSGELLAAAVADGTIELWNPTSSKLIDRLAGHRAMVTTLAIDPAGDWLAAGGSDRQITIWHLDDRRLAHTIGIGGDAAAVAFTPDGARLAATTGLRTIGLWQPESGEQTRLLGGRGSTVFAVAIDPAERYLASAHMDRSVKLWDLRAGSLARTLRGHQRSVLGLAFAPGGDRLASASRDGSVITWDVASGDRLATLVGHTDEVMTAAFSPAGDLLASGSLDRKVAIWSDPKAPPKLLAGHQQGVTRVAFASADELLSAGHDGVVNWWQPATGQQQKSVTWNQPIETMVVGPAGLVIGGNAGGIATLTEQGELSTLAAHRGAVLALASAPDGTIASAGLDNLIKLWPPGSLAKGEPSLQLGGHSNGISALRFGRRGARLVSAGQDFTIKLWDVTRGLLLATLVGTGDDGWVIVAEDGRVDGAAGDDGGASLLHWSVGELRLPGFVGWQREQAPGLLGQLWRSER